MTEHDFLRAYDQFSDAIFRHCYYRVYDREQAKDLTQETFVRTWEFIIKGTEVKNIRAFLYRVATNLVIDESRKKKAVSLNLLQESGFEPASTEHLQLPATVDANAMIVIIGRLDETHRDVLMMRYVDNLKPKEIAAVLSVSANVVSVRLHRAMKELRLLLKHE